MNVVCPICGKAILPGDPRVSWFTKNESNDTTERGAIHLEHIFRAHLGGVR